MRLEFELIINQYAQNLKSQRDVISYYESLSEKERSDFFDGLVFMILQSKATVEDIDLAIDKASLKPSLTPCNMIRKGVNEFNLRRLVALTGKERLQTLMLFLGLFSVGYQRKYEVEKGNPNKWWFWDLSDPEILSKIK